MERMPQGIIVKLLVKLLVKVRESFGCTTIGSVRPDTGWTSSANFA